MLINYFKKKICLRAYRNITQPIDNNGRTQIADGSQSREGIRLPS